jgi:hypothetical protein
MVFIKVFIYFTFQRIEPTTMSSDPFSMTTVDRPNNSGCDGLSFGDGCDAVLSILSAYDLRPVDFNRQQKRMVLVYARRAEDAIRRYGQDGYGDRPDSIGVWDYWIQHQDWKKQAETIRKLAKKNQTKPRKTSKKTPL